MRIAIVHDWFVNYAGSERVIEQMLNCFPEADLFSLIDFLPNNSRNFIKNKPVKISFIQKMPFARKHYRGYLPLMPFAIEQFDLSNYDVIISSSHCVAKGIIVGPDQLHISYVYSPMRYAWDFQFQYLRESGLSSGLRGLFTKYVLHKIRQWDVTTANRVDYFLTLSNFIKRRIQKSYRRDSVVICPPVSVEKFSLCEKKENFYLAVSRLVPYKRIDLIVDAFKQLPEKRLIVIGDGPEMKKIQLKAKGCSNIDIKGFQPFAILKEHMQKAKAFIYAAEDDFSIVTVEAQACGTPVIAYGKGAVLEILQSPEDSALPTGLFFRDQTPKALVEAIRLFEEQGTIFLPKNCRENALRYQSAIFCEKFKQFVMDKWSDYSKALK